MHDDDDDDDIKLAGMSWNLIVFVSEFLFLSCLMSMMVMNVHVYLSICEIRQKSVNILY